MNLMAQLNSLPMFLIAGSAIAFVILMCVVFLIKSYRAGIAIGMDKAKLKKAITASAAFTVLPSISILLGVIALSGSLGVPLPWVRLSVIGALHYEASVADIAARNVGVAGGLGSGTLTASAFVTIGLVMTAGIIWSMLLCIFGLKKYLARMQKPSIKKDGKKGFADVAFVAMFVGLVSAYIGSYVGVFASTGDYIPLAVAALAAAAMAGLEALSHQRGFAWLDSFSMAGSMLVGMGGAVVLGLL
ncbi:MAG: DUF5058 family protein [Oscillospiraceae bacterium]|nr:DUF5058 family protein [Oscillospiraceae bacterium]